MIGDARLDPPSAVAGAACQPAGAVTPAGDRMMPVTDVARRREEYMDSAVAVAVTLIDAATHDPRLLADQPMVAGALRRYIEAREAYLGDES